MKNLVLDFPLQLQEALIIGKNYRFITPGKEFNNVVVTSGGKWYWWLYCTELCF